MCWYILFRVERPWWGALRSIDSQLNRVSVIHLEGTGRTLAPAGVELSSSNTRAGTHSNWQSILSVGNISQLLMQTQWPWQWACLTDLLYSHLFPMRTRRPVERGGVRVWGGKGGGAASSATHGTNLKRLLKERTIVWTGLQGTSLTSQFWLCRKHAIKSCP